MLSKVKNIILPSNSNTTQVSGSNPHLRSCLKKSKTGVKQKKQINFNEKIELFDSEGIKHILDLPNEEEILKTELRRKLEMNDEFPNESTLYAESDDEDDNADTHELELTYEKDNNAHNCKKFVIIQLKREFEKCNILFSETTNSELIIRCNNDVLSVQALSVVRTFEDQLMYAIKGKLSGQTFTLLFEFDHDLQKQQIVDMISISIQSNAKKESNLRGDEKILRPPNTSDIDNTNDKNDDLDDKSQSNLTRTSSNSTRPSLKNSKKVVRTNECQTIKKSTDLRNFNIGDDGDHENSKLHKSDTERMNTDRTEPLDFSDKLTPNKIAIASPINTPPVLSSPPLSPPSSSSPSLASSPPKPFSSTVIQNNVKNSAECHSSHSRKEDDNTDAAEKPPSTNQNNQTTLQMNVPLSSKPINSPPLSPKPITSPPLSPKPITSPPLSPKSTNFNSSISQNDSTALECTPVSVNIQWKKTDQYEAIKKLSNNDINRIKDEDGNSSADYDEKQSTKFLTTLKSTLFSSDKKKFRDTYNLNELKKSSPSSYPTQKKNLKSPPLSPKSKTPNNNTQLSSSLPDPVVHDHSDNSSPSLSFSLPPALPLSVAPPSMSQQLTSPPLPAKLDSISSNKIESNYQTTKVDTISRATKVDISTLQKNKPLPSTPSKSPPLPNTHQTPNSLTQKPLPSPPLSPAITQQITASKPLPSIPPSNQTSTFVKPLPAIPKHGYQVSSRARIS